MTKDDLHRKGWSLREASKKLGCSVPHMSKVLSGTRISHSLTRALKKLPKRTPNKYTVKQIAVK